MSGRKARCRGWFAGVVVAGVLGLQGVRADGDFAALEPANTTTGYLARLLINETPFPGERAYVSEEETKTAMLQILWVLHGRIHLIPAGYTQQQVAGVRTDDIIVVITGGGGRRQCEGFYEDAAGRPRTEPRVEERIRYLLGIANKGSGPGRFARLLNYGQGLARAYVKEGIQGADAYADLMFVGSMRVTGHAYSWMTNVNNYHPGGNYVFIPDEEDGAFGGNRFFTLRRDPK
ncbi:MAG TPA: hypothetical protein VM008_15215 [Phycisphaerae bacterium]|nr:hypothetical protein [Phycisphaerae bacterium]